MNLEQFKQNPKTKYLALQYEQLLVHDPEAAKYLWQQMQEIMEGSDRSNQGDSNIGEPKGIILEVRAGAGGDEADIFAHDLAQMYGKYALKRGWIWEPIDDLIYELRGKDVYSELKYESGVHRIQRVPTTEKSGRIHTSTASVAVMPIREKSTIQINPADIELSFTRSG